MALTRPRFLSCILAAVLLIPFPAAAFETPLSDTAVREAYFMGQRREAMANFPEKYTRHLPQPKTGPYISNVAFYTPLTLVVFDSSQQGMGYSAQQAIIDHHNSDESMLITIEIDFTDSYGALIARPTGSRSGSPIGYKFRSPGFWKDFGVQVFSKQDPVKVLSASGKPNYLCSDDGGCTLTGATLTLEFPAAQFADDYATVQVTPSEGEPVTIDFDRSAIR